MRKIPQPSTIDPAPFTLNPTASKPKPTNPQLSEGATLYSNKDYVSPNVIRSREKLEKSIKYANRKEGQKKSVARKQLQPQMHDPFKQVFK